MSRSVQGRTINLLREEIRARSDAEDARMHAHDCSEVARILAAYSRSIGSALLLGHWQSEVQRERFYILSASFIVNPEKYEALDKRVEVKNLYDRKDIEAVKAVATQLGLLEGKRIVIELDNVTCVFSAGVPDDVCHDVAVLYQRLLLSSQNFSNFIDGRIYRFSKPANNGEPHPQFEIYNEIPTAITKVFGIQGAYFLFSGDTQAIRSEELEIRATDLRDSHNTSIAVVVPFHQDVAFRRSLKASITNKQPTTGFAGTSSEDFYFGVFPAFDASIRGSPIEGMLVIWHKSPIEMIAFRAAATWLKEFAARRHLEKLRFLSTFRDATAEELRRVRALTRPGRNDRQNATRKLSSLLCKQICSLTNAESATVRLRHDTKGLIHCYGRFETPLGQYNEGGKRYASDISVAAWQTSAVAFAFHYRAAVDHIYIPNVHQMPHQYAEAGLKGVLQVRPDTRCEAVIRVRRGGLLSAVINVESPIADALRHELQFLEDCGDLLSDFLTRLETVGDGQGLAVVAETHVEVHAIKTRLMTWRPDQPAAAVTLLTQLKRKLVNRARTGRKGSGKAGDTGFTLGDSVAKFNKVWRARFEAHLAGVGSDVPVTIVLRGKVPKDFPTERLASLEVIMDSVWHNMIKYSAVQRNRCALSSEVEAFGTSSVLKFEWNAPSNLPPKVDRDRLLLQPAVGADGLHFGFFLIGVHARLMGGHVELEELEAGFTLRVFLPYEPIELQPKKGGL